MAGKLAQYLTTIQVLLDQMPVIVLGFDGVGR
jgi:hypothetical protein